MEGLIGKKVGMTQVYDADGVRTCVTVIEVGPCPVVQLKTAEKDGYVAAQLGFGEQKVKRLSKAVAGHLKKTGGQEGGQNAQDNHKNAGDIPCQHKTVDHGTAACGAYAHDTGDTQIEVTDLLGQNLTRGAIEECHAQRNRVQQKIQDVFHA